MWGERGDARPAAPLKKTVGREAQLGHKKEAAQAIA
jgi:hypothetical protein